MATSRKFNKRTREQKGIQKPVLAAKLFSCFKVYIGSKSTYACQHVLAGWLAEIFFLTEDLSTHSRLLISSICVAPNLHGLNTFSCCNANGYDSLWRGQMLIFRLSSGASKRPRDVMMMMMTMMMVMMTMIMVTMIIRERPFSLLNLDNQSPSVSFYDNKPWFFNTCPYFMAIMHLKMSPAR